MLPCINPALFSFLVLLFACAWILSGKARISNGSMSEDIGFTHTDDEQERALMVFLIH